MARLMANANARQAADAKTMATATVRCAVATLLRSSLTTSAWRAVLSATSSSIPALSAETACWFWSLSSNAIPAALSPAVASSYTRARVGPQPV